MPFSSISISTLSRSPWNVSVRGPPGPLPRTIATAVSPESATRARNSRSASTVRQVNAASAARMTLSSTGGSCSAARSSRNSSSSLHLSELTPVTSCGPVAFIAAWSRGQVCAHCVGFPQPVQAAPKTRADAPDLHPQQLADLLIGLRWVAGSKPQKLLISHRQLAHAVAQSLAELGSKDPCVGVDDFAPLHSVVGVRIDRHHPMSALDLVPAFAPGGLREPAWQRLRVAQVCQVLNEPQPDGLAHVLRVHGIELVGTGDGHHEWRVPAHQLIPGSLIAARARPN